MKRKLVLSTALAAGLALAATGGALAKTYYGVVGPGPTITFKNAKGNTVTRIRTGTHTIKVNDRSSAHNFHLLGQGINKKTRLGFVGRKTWRLSFPEGRYVYRCDPHRRHMRGSFRAVA
jgi:plastocyanin